MKNFFFLTLLLIGCSVNHHSDRESLSLAGEWKFQMDSLDSGVNEKWYSGPLNETVILPGSMAGNGKGFEVSVNTDWTGDIVDKSWFTEKKYEKYRQPGNIKIPFWLKPVKTYKGVAWYQKEIELPADWKGKEVTLFLERCHWESSVYINDKKAGTRNSLATPHEYDITDLLVDGGNRITIRMDNRVIIPVGVNSHSITDHTQSNWNGIAGTISLNASSRVSVKQIRIYPDISQKSAKVIISLENNSGAPFKGEIELATERLNKENHGKLKRKVIPVSVPEQNSEVVAEYPMENNIQLWSEFNPVMYKLSVTLKGHKGETVDLLNEDFGMREFKASGTRFEVNKNPVFLRGTTECCIFPLTGYPPTDTGSWEKILKTVKDYGLNHVRFHSYCPPEAAFVAADRLGIYFHIECSSWANQGSSVGNGGAIDQFIYEEGDRIINEYGNHPSFCMLAYGNEPAGSNQKEFLGKLITYWKSKDNRRVYTSAAGWPIIPENDYNLSSDPRIQHWGEGLKSIINAQPPQTIFDYRDFVSKYQVPVVSHEIGQWCVYPDFKEIAKYTGVLKATNFEIFRETLAENHMAGQAQDFLMASGKLQVLCYKADIEAALRTPGFAGFQILQLHDFPGQGTALVGILNPFFESKGYVTAEEFRMFCNATVPLARMQKLIYKNNESFNADIEIAHFGAAPIHNAVIISKIIDSGGHILLKDSTTAGEIKVGNCFPAGSVRFDLKGIAPAQKLIFEVSVNNTPFRNRWDFWVYPEKNEFLSGRVFVTGTLDSKAREVLKKGGSVLLLTYGKVGKDRGAQVVVGFSSVFWNTAWTKNQAPHTMGILCDPGHPLFSDFPTEYHSNWQWWDPVTHSQAMILDKFPPNLKPLIQLIDTWFENRRLALAFETRTGGGKLMVCSIDLNGELSGRAVSGQLYSSVLKYMNGSFFNPLTEIETDLVEDLLRN
jgi:Glycosyl hydrolases family 2, sugar binding domain/Glycosyl hydrolases family 2